MENPNKKLKYTISNLDNDKYKDYSVSKEEPKQKTLEKNLTFPLIIKNALDYLNLTTKIFNNGAKWQQERMYSEAIKFAEWIRIKDFQTTSKDNWIGLDMKYYTTEELFE